MKIGDEVYVHGFIDEIRNDVIIIRNDGGYFGTAPSEVVNQEPNEDKRTGTHACNCINRQATIERLREFANDDLTSTEKAIGADYCVDLIRTMPSAQPFTEEQIQTMQELESAQLEKAYELGKADRLKWIPCGERLPKKDGRYQVTRYDYVTNTEFIDILWYEENLWWNRHSTGDYAVTAWMPLPEAYREGGEEE